MNDVRALLLTDVADSTLLTEALGDATMAALWADHDRVARDLLPLHRGREIDKTDGMLLLFDRAEDALAYADAYHAALTRLTPPLLARAGLHVGPLTLRENPPADVARGAKPLEVDGLAKPVTARVMALARSGQTLMTAAAVAALPPEAVQPPLLGHWRFKGVSEPMALYQAGDGQASAPPDGDKAYAVVRVGERWLPVREIPNNLPQQATSFLGRERELDELHSALHAARLVTLLGMGGLGKTRLSLQVAAELLAEYPDGAWFLDLSPLSEPGLVVEEAARLLKVREEAGRPLLQTLCDQVRGRRLMLVIDNCEHLVAASAALAHALLRAAPELRIMASSRIALRVPGEHVYPVLPLPLPEAGSSAAVLAGSTAVRLFVERARSHRPTFALTEVEAPHVADLVARLEGIPLALELAAARVRSLTVADINTRLKDRYKLLTGGSRVHQQRQQTLRALVDWSYDLLDANEQRLFCRLGVFAGGFDLATAEAVCGAEPLDPLDTLDLLDSLVEKSLVMLDTTGIETRYRMLDTLREYAREKLDQDPDGDGPATAGLHCQHFWAFARHARDGLQGPQQAEWVQRIEADLDNLRAAMALARSGGVDPLLAAKLPVALQGFWVMRGRLGEGRELVRGALALPAVQASEMASAHTLYVAAVLADAQGDPLEAQRLLETCLALRRGLQDDAGTAITLSTLSMARLATGQAETALTAQEEALTLLRAQGHHTGEAIALQQHGRILRHLGRDDEAIASAREALAMAQALANLELEGECACLLGALLQDAGDLEAAADALQRALVCGQDAGDRRNAALARAALGRLALARGDAAASQPLLAEAMQAFHAFEMRAEQVDTLEDHACLALALGRFDAAAALLGCAQAVRQATSLVRPPKLAAQVDEVAAALARQLGKAAYDAALAAGQALPLAEAVQRALNLPAA